MISDAITDLLNSYNKYDEMKDVEKKQKIVAEQLKIFTKENFERKLEEITKLRNNDTNAANVLQYNRLFTEFEIYKIQYETYCAMNEDIGQYDNLKKEMEKKIRKVKAFNKDVIRIQSTFENLKINGKKSR